MPLVERTRGGAGQWIEPAPHRPQINLSAERARKLAAAMVWRDYRREGLSLAQVSVITSEPISNIRRGLRELEQWLESEGMAERSDWVPSLTPIFGCEPYPSEDLTAEQVQKQKWSTCPKCGGRWTGETTTCGYCWRSTAGNDRKLARQRDRDKILTARAKANWVATDPRTTKTA